MADGAAISAPAAVDITVQPVNDPPTADPQAVATDEDTPLVITLTGSDPEGDGLAFAVVTPPGDGMLGPVTPIDSTSAQVTYTPDPGFHGPDGFTFTVDDGAAISMPAAVDITVNSVFACSKPIDALTMIWDGTQPVRVKAWNGMVGGTLLADVDNIAVGNELMVVGFAGGPNDVFWEVFAAGSSTKLGESKFHLSCSDDDMNGPEDCGKRQGDGKQNDSGFINDWLFEGMVDSDETLDCS